MGAGYFCVKKNNKYSIIDQNGNLLFGFVYLKLQRGETIPLDAIRITRNCITFNGKTKFKPIPIEMDDYNVKKTIFGYTCSNSIDSYKVKYMPIKRYGLRYTLCLNKNKILLYDRINNQYTMEWDVEDIEYDDKFIFDKKIIKCF